MAKKLIFVLFDSLVRNALGAYGGTEFNTPNFDRFAKMAVTFDNHWAGSLPCMPARREMHTGRYNFLHRGWGPIEPYDTSVFEILKDCGIYSHLVTDHFHYFEDGGATYHGRYSSWDNIRGQECDKWKGVVNPPIEMFKQRYDHRCYDLPAEKKRLTHCITREFIREEADFPCARSFESGIEFLDKNRNEDGWVLQIECFDPHEPFFAPKRFRDEAGVDDDSPVLDWPRYGVVTEDDFAQDQIRANYKASVHMCDHYFGQLLDYLDEHDMWEDTAIVLTTDHGFLLGEHERWAKNRVPFYNEVAHIPLMIYAPEMKAMGGRHCKSLTQTIDLAPTLLDFFGLPPCGTMTGKSLLPALSHDIQIRDVALFGIFGGSLNITDGRYTYFHYPKDMSSEGLYEYTLLPCHMNHMFTVEQLQNIKLGQPFNFTQGVPLLQIPALAQEARQEIGRKFLDTQSVLYDIKTDYTQKAPIRDTQVIQHLLSSATDVFRLHDAPAELYKRFGLDCVE